jgi:peptide/nickel transport system substrate-binding protein
MIYQPLVTFGPNMELVPLLAESWEMKDERTWQLKLRQGVKWHNGRDFVIEDVIYSYDRIMDPATGSIARDWMANVDSYKAVDKQTLQLNLKAADAQTPYSLYWSYIIPQEVKDRPQGFLKGNAIGTGAFKLESWQPDVATKLVRFDKYWEKDLPYLDGIEIRIFPEEATAIAALRAGEVDHLTLTDNNNFELLKRNPDLVLMQKAYNGAYWMNFNGNKPPMDDLKVRQAMSTALDREEFLKVVGAGLGEVCGVVPPVFKDFFVPPAELPNYTYDPEKAKQLLKESSVPNGFKMDILTIPTSPLRTGSAELCKKFWEAIGIQVEIRAMETNVWLDTVVNTEDFYFNTNVTLKHAIPEGIYLAHLACGSFLASVYGPCFQELDDLARKSMATTDPAERKQLLRQLQIGTAEKIPTIITFCPNNVDALQSWVKGFEPWPDTQHRGWQYMWLDKA